MRTMRAKHGLGLVQQDPESISILYLTAGTALLHAAKEMTARSCQRGLHVHHMYYYHDINDFLLFLVNAS